MNIANAIRLMVGSKRIYTNLITNHSFESDLTGWTLYINSGITVSAETDKFYLGSKSFKGVGASSNIAAIYRQPITFINGRKYYFFCYGRSSSTNNANIGMRIYSNTTNLAASVITVTSGNINTWLRSVGILQTSNGTETHIAVVVAETAANTGWVDALHLVDLTAEFGAGNEPDLAWCEANIDETNFA